MKISEQEHDIVIVGGGICGLATALALHRKGIKSLVLERLESLRVTGVGIIMQGNGWRALDQLGVAPKLRQTAIEIPWEQFITVDNGKFRESEVAQRKGEIRCLKRVELMEALAEELPAGTVHVGCRVVSIILDPVTSHPILQLKDGTLIKAKIKLDHFKIRRRKFHKAFLSMCDKGVTYYEHYHRFGNKSLLYGSNNVADGQLPVTNKLVYWYLTRSLTSQDLSDSKKDPSYIREAAVEATKGFPEEVIEMVKGTASSDLYLTDLLENNIYI